MSAATTLTIDADDTAATAHVPTELRAIFEESAKVKASFLRLPARDRDGFVRYIEEGTAANMRQHRARIIGKSLFGLAPDLKDDAR